MMRYLKNNIYINNSCIICANTILTQEPVAMSRVTFGAQAAFRGTALHIFISFPALKLARAKPDDILYFVLEHVTLYHC